jgi:RNA polymerase sigma factor (sigma-70 family)
MAAVPSIGRAARVQGIAAPEADLTRTLYEQYANQIFRYCLHQLGSREEAEDAVQSTFLNAFRGIKRGIVPELESAWLFKIANNVCLSRRRSTWRRGRIESPADFEVVEQLSPAPSAQADELIGLQDALEQMPESQRRAILLREWQGLSYREIAEELELSQAAVETLIFRARRSLAQGLDRPVPKKRRLVRGADLAGLVGGLKSVLLGGSAAVKIAAAVAVISATTVVAAGPVRQHAPASSLPVTAATPAASVAQGGSTAAFAEPDHPASWQPSAPAPKSVHAVEVEPDGSAPAQSAAVEPSPPAADTTPAAPASAETPGPPAPLQQPPAETTSEGTPLVAPASAPASPPGQAKKQDTQSSSAPDTSGSSVAPPGQDRSGPGQNIQGDAPGSSATAPGQSASAPGQANQDSGSSTPGQTKKDDPAAPQPLSVAGMSIALQSVPALQGNGNGNGNSADADDGNGNAKGKTK